MRPIGTPCDVALVRMQADSAKPKAEQRGYKNVFDALARVAKEEVSRGLVEYVDACTRRRTLSSLSQWYTNPQILNAILYVCLILHKLGSG